MNLALHRFAVLTAVCTCLLLGMGALVTSNDAGDSVPDWPLSYGKLIPPLVGNIRYEWGHRVAAGIVLLMTLVLAAWLQRSDDRRWVKSLGWLAFGAVMAQALLGGVRVLNPGLAKPLAMVHATLAQLFFCTVVAIGVVTGRWWRSGPEQLEDNGSPSIRGLANWTLGVIFLQLLLGALSRHFKFVVNPHLIVAPHVVNALIVLVLTVLVSTTTRSRFASVRALRGPARWLSALVGVQILLGLAAYATVILTRDEPQPMPIMVWATVAHLVVGALVLACSVVLTLCAHRQIRGGAQSALETSEERVTA